MKHSMALLCLIFTTITSFSQDISGKWNGKINNTQFVFSFEKTDTIFKTTVDVPSQRVYGLQPKTTTIYGDSLMVDISNIGIVFKGKIAKNRTEIAGTIKENANTFPLTLRKGAIKKQTVTNRPQEPVKPYPYQEEDVVFNNKTDNVSLSGTLTLPKENAKHPAVVLITGSGPQDRDQTFSGHKTFLVLADYLTRKGIAVLRYDDRGFGKSTGVFTEATTYDFATDAISAVDYLKTRPDIDHQKIGLIGHSEGGIIAPLAANRSKDIAFIVSMAGTGIIGSQLSLTQAIQQRPFPVPDEEDYKKNIEKAISIASQDKELSIIQKELKEHYYKTIVPIIKPLMGSDEKVAEAVNNLINSRTTKWFRYFYNYNPAQEMEKIKIPMFYLIGSNDKQVLPEMNIQGVQKAFEKNKTTEHKIVKLEGLNHLFQDSTTGEMKEYRTIEQTISPTALNEISSWILAQTNGKL